MNKRDFAWGMLYGAGAFALVLKLMDWGAAEIVKTYFDIFYEKK